MLRLLVATLMLIMALDAAKSQDSEPTRADDASRQWAEIAHGIKHMKTRKYRDAQDAFRGALKGLEKIYGKDSPEIAPAIVYLSTANAALGKKRQQSKLYDRALALIARHHGKSSTEYADIKLRAGLSLLEYTGDVVGALMQVEDANDIYGELTGSIRAGQASAVLSLGHMYWMEGQSEKAEQYLSRAEDMITELPDLADARLGLAALSLGKTFLRVDAFEIAQHYFLIALKGLNTAHPESMHDHVDARSWMVVAYVLDGKSDMASEHCAAIGYWAYQTMPEAYTASHDFLPAVRWAPVYPPRLIAQGVEGFVDFSLTVDEKGFVRSPKVIKVGGHKDFIPAALSALCKFKYKPQIENGEPVVVEDVKTRISFQFD